MKINKGKLKNLSLLNAIYPDYKLGKEYFGDNNGNVYKSKDEEDEYHEMSPYVNRDGYVEFVLTNKEGIKKHIMGHIVTCGLWNIKPKGKDYVNHKDGKRDNNFYKNLEWSTQAENIQHSYDELRSNKK